MAQLDALYRELPTIACQRQCQDACGPIFMSRVEWQRIIKKLGYEPRGCTSDLVCPMLQQGLCSVYHVRPMICRLWGLVETLRCPWGCEPSRVLTHAEGLLYIARADYISDPEHAMPPEEFERLMASHPDRLALSRLLVQAPQRTEGT